MHYQIMQLSPRRAALYAFEGNSPRERLRSIILLRRGSTEHRWMCAACGRRECEHARVMNNRDLPGLQSA